MKGLTRYYKRIRAQFILTAFCVFAAAVLFVPSFPAFEPEENNVYEIWLNGRYAGLTEEPEETDALLARARAAVASEKGDAASGDMVFAETELEYRGRTELFGRVDTREGIRDQLQGILEDSVLDILQRAYTVKINEYTVNLRSSGEVLELLDACLDRYDTKDQYTVELNVDPGRELNVLTASVCRTEELEEGESREGAGLEAFFAETLAQAEPARTRSFEELDYGLVGLEFADIVEVTEAYLTEEELTPLAEAVEQVMNEQAKEEIYEIQPGDTLSEIALEHSLPMEDLIAINPALEDENSIIRAGQELIITVPEPELSVIHRELVYEEENYNAPVEYVDVDEWYTNQEETVQEPSEGHRKVAAVKTFRNGQELSDEIVLEEVDFEAVPKIVRKGTRIPPTFIKPISGGVLTSSYGRRSAPTAGASTNHQGTDWATPVGTAVVASCGGTVTRAGWASGYGYVVYIQHEGGRETRYAHLSRVLVSVGEHVDQGERIALSGNTGRSTGPHLHFEIRINGSAVNAVDYLE